MMENKSTLTLWTIVSEQDYPLLEFTLTDALSSEAVSHIIILSTGPSKPVKFGRYASRHEKVREFYQYFGNGFDLPVEQGGFNQIAARNHALSLAEKTTASWLMQIDADDYYLPEFFQQIVTLDKDFDAILCSSVNLLSENEYWNKNQGEFTNPHIRVWRTSLAKRFKICDISSCNQLNFTGHCGVDFSYHPYWKIFLQKKFVHFHLHGILGKKNTNRWQSAVARIDLEVHRGLMFCIKQIRNYATQH